MGVFVLKIQVEKISKDVSGSMCLMDKDMYDALRIREDRKYQIHLGQRKIFSSIKVAEKKGRCMYFTKEALNQLLIYNKIDLSIWTNNDEIYLGPVVGMFVPKEYIREIQSGNPPIGAVEHMQEAAPYANCLGYCFCVDNVDWQEKRIKGVTFDATLNRWRYDWMPMPDVVYDRAAYMYGHEKEQATDIRDQFQVDSNVRFVNPVGSLGKWPLYKNLSRYSEIRDYLPETILYKTFDDIKHMLNKYDFIFFKSSFGSRGEEVLSVEKNNGKYRIDYYDRNLKIVHADDLESLKMNVEKFIEDKKKNGRQRFIVQQGIRLIKFDGHNMDFRMHIVKNEQGKWEVTNYYAIHSRGNSKITNFCVGGDIDLYENVYEKLKADHPDIAIPTQEELGKITVKMGTFIERAFGLYGEIGIDMAIDENGKVWFIEGNAKPDKYRTPGLDDMDGPAPQAVAIFQYSKYLAKNRK